jgi:hypothetical protein
MPGFAVYINDAPVVVVSTDGLDLLAVDVSGDRAGERFASLRVSGGAYPEDESSTYLTWIENRVLTAAETVSVRFLEQATNSQPGLTIEEMHPEASDWPSGPFKSPEDTIRELMKEPLLHEQIDICAIGPAQERISITTLPEEHGFGLSISWLSNHASTARVALHTYTLQSLIDKSGTNYHLKARMQCAQEVKIKVAPNNRMETDA